MIYVMSDLHCAWTQYVAMKEKINFSNNDTLYILGDVLDRCSSSEIYPLRILDDIMQHDNIHLILGNHELTYLEIFKTSNLIQSFEFNNNVSNLLPLQKHLQSLISFVTSDNFFGINTYSYLFHSIDDKRLRKYMTFLLSCPTELFLEVEDKQFYLTHGSLNTNSTLRTSDRLNMHLSFIPKIVDGKLVDFFQYDNFQHTLPQIELINKHYSGFENGLWKPECFIVIGHTPTNRFITPKDFFKIAFINNNINIDCGCSQIAMEFDYKDKPSPSLACLRLDDLSQFYVTHPLL